MLDIESALWLTLGSFSLVFMTKCAIINLGCSLLFATIPSERPSSLSSSLWRTTTQVSEGDSEGLLMSCTLINLLLHVMSISDDRWTVYTAVAFPINALPRSVTAKLAFLGLLGASLLQPKSFIFVAFWQLAFYSIRMYPSMQGVWTFGEWTVVTCFLAITFTEIVFLEAIGEDQVCYVVASAGTLGCLLACAISAKIPILQVRALILVLMPLSVVETVLQLQSFDIPQPMCLHWLFNFLLHCESDLTPRLPRFFWILYWLVVLAITVPISAHSKFIKLAPPVVLRKWFHLIAILLFTPVTVFAPQLMGLAYSVALCGLAVLECVRPQLPNAIQNFYGGFLDTDKDTLGRVVVSHITLISGCAFPTWYSACIGDERTVLKLWGVAALGVGDSLAAVVGSSWGRTHWGWDRKRSLEGSLAMVVALSTCCSFMGKQWLLAVLFTTLVEAFTSQIDNLVLPLVGTGLLANNSIQR